MKKVLKYILLIVALSFLFFGFKSVYKDNKKEPSEEEKLLASMSLEEKVGQMFIVRVPKEEKVEAVTKYHLGGYIMFARDFKDKSKDEVINEIKSYQDTSKIPMLIGVDEEGGKVVRVSSYFKEEPFKSMQDLYNEGGVEKVVEDAKEKSKFLKEFGINVNFGPVSDVSTDPNDYIYKRTLGKSASETADVIKNVVSAMKDEKIGSVLKHFPGYGNNVDTHTGIAIDTRSYENFANNDFLPFKSGIDAGANMVMVSHNIVSSMDPDNPASLSLKVHKILRNVLKFDGVIVTDDLYMDAIKKYTNNEEAAILAINAGNDLICATDFEEQIPAVIKAVKDGKIKEEQINESVLKILKMKKELGII